MPKSPTSPAGKVLTFIVQENPTVQEVKFVGNKKIKEKDLLAAIVTKPYSILQRNVVSDDVQKILKLYQQKGYYNAEVTSKIEFPKDPHKAVVTFNIDEKNKVYIKSINFTGNKNISARKLRGAMQTKVKSILSLVTDRGILQKEILETDLDRLTAYYHDEGYMDAKVSSPKIDLKEDGFHITIAVEEGERYKVTDVKLTGDLLEGYEQKIVKKLELKPNSYFSREKVRHDMDFITDLTRTRAMRGLMLILESNAIPKTILPISTSISIRRQDCAHRSDFCYGQYENERLRHSARVEDI